MYLCYRKTKTKVAQYKFFSFYDENLVFELSRVIFDRAKRFLQSNEDWARSLKLYIYSRADKKNKFNRLEHGFFMFKTCFL